MYDYDRSRNAAKDPPKKFRVDDAVEVMDGNEVLYSGTVQSIDRYDEYQETWKYKVKIVETGKRLTFNEKSLRKKGR